MAQDSIGTDYLGILGLDVFDLDDVDRKPRELLRLTDEREVLLRAAQSLDGDVDVRVFGKVSRIENRAPLVDPNGGVMFDDHGNYGIGVLFRLFPEPAPALGSPLITGRQPGAGGGDQG
jgi:hypothetical protein